MKKLGAMRRWIVRGRLSLALMLCACSDSLLGPEDPRYDDFCVVYVSAEERPRMADAVRERITAEQIHRCRPIQVYVVDFETG